MSAVYTTSSTIHIVSLSAAVLFVEYWDFILSFTLHAPPLHYWSVILRCASKSAVDKFCCFSVVFVMEKSHVAFFNLLLSMGSHCDGKPDTHVQYGGQNLANITLMKTYSTESNYNSYNSTGRGNVNAFWACMLPSCSSVTEYRCCISQFPTFTVSRFEVVAVPFVADNGHVEQGTHLRAHQLKANDFCGNPFVGVFLIRLQRKLISIINNRSSWQAINSARANARQIDFVYAQYNWFKRSRRLKRHTWPSCSCLYVEAGEMSRSLFYCLAASGTCSALEAGSEVYKALTKCKALIPFCWILGSCVLDCFSKWYAWQYMFVVTISASVWSDWLGRPCRFKGMMLCESHVSWGDSYCYILLYCFDALEDFGRIIVMTEYLVPRFRFMFHISRYCLHYKIAMLHS